MKYSPSTIFGRLEGEWSKTGDDKRNAWTLRVFTSAENQGPFIDQITDAAIGKFVERFISAYLVWMDSSLDPGSPEDDLWALLWMRWSSAASIVKNIRMDALLACQRLLRPGGT